MKPTYENFKKLVGKGDFAESVVKYDPKNLSEYAFNQLTSYINNKDFTFEYLLKISRTGAHLCKWCIAVYNYTKAINEVIRVCLFYYYKLKIFINYFLFHLL